MAKKLYSGLAFAALFLALLVACAPKVAPTTSPAAPEAVAPKPLPAASPEEVAWAKTVEAAKREGKITAYSYGWTGDTGLAVERAFEARYGVDLEIITGRGAEFTERLKMEKRLRQIVADMTEGSPIHLNNMQLAGLLAPVADALPALREKGVWLVEPLAIDPQDKANLTWRITTYTPYINTKLVKGEEIPKSWKDLLDPKWKGLMTLTEPNISPSTTQAMVVFFDNKIWDEDYIRALYGQKLRFVAGGFPDEFRILARGESSLAIVVSDSDSGRFAAEGAPIQAIGMREGIVLSTASIAAIAGGPHPNAAQVLVNWLFTQEGQTVAGKAQINKMVRKDVPDFRHAAAQASLTNPLVLSNDQMQRAATRFREKWFDKIVGR